MRVVVVLLCVAPLFAATPAYLVKDINTTAQPGDSFPTHFVTLGNLAFFTKSNSAAHPLQLWRTDGTDGGTFSLGATDDALVVWNGRVWFRSAGALSSTDGSIVGTTKVSLPHAVTAASLM